MALKSPEEKAIEKFLSKQETWLRKVLQGDFSLTKQEQSELCKQDWPDVLGRAEDEYLRLLARCPEKLREHRKREAKSAAKSAVSRLPSLPLGAPRNDALAQEAKDLQQSRLSHPEIAHRLNKRYPNRVDRKGNRKPITAEGVRKLLNRTAATDPDKI